MRFSRRIFGLVALGLFSSGAGAQQAYPAKPIRLIVPFPAGGGTDILARQVANKLTERLKWNIVVDNRAGAGGNIGIDAAAKSPPDGYTIVMGQTSNLAINPSLYSKLPYDPVKDFAPISLVAAFPIAITVSAKGPHKSLSEVIAAAKAKPDTVTFASSGNGTVSHLTAELLQRTAGVKLIHIPYKGAAQAFPDLIGGRINMFLSSLETALPQVKAGTVRAIAVTSAKRAPVLPDVPSVGETYKGFEATTWFGILAPARTPEPIVEKLNDEITKVLQLPDVREHMAAGGSDVRTGPKEFAAVLKSDLVKWSKIVKESGAKVE
jgi:tripartite-type tricarboxylate transporter receptor subunit TctC